MTGSVTIAEYLRTKFDDAILFQQQTCDAISNFLGNKGACRGCFDRNADIRIKALRRIILQLDGEEIWPCYPSHT